MARYQDFVLMLQPISHDPKAVWYRSEEPIEWTDARDRIAATGATLGYQIGGHGKGRFMISVDPREVELHRRSGRKAVQLHPEPPTTVRGKTAYILSTGHFECLDCCFLGVHEDNGEPAGSCQLVFVCPDCGRQTKAWEVVEAAHNGIV
jgi:hypothetical protein